MYKIYSSGTLAAKYKSVSKDMHNSSAVLQSLPQGTLFLIVFKNNYNNNTMDRVKIQLQGRDFGRDLFLFYLLIFSITPLPAHPSRTFTENSSISLSLIILSY